MQNCNGRVGWRYVNRKNILAKGNDTHRGPGQFVIGAELEVVRHNWSTAMRTKLVEIETNKNPLMRALHCTVLKNLNFSTEQGKDFSKGKVIIFGFFRK